MSRLPTENQYHYLLRLGSGSALVVGKKRETEMYLSRGWVTAKHGSGPSYPYSWIRITPDGLRALALAVEKYGLPQFDSQPAPSEAGGSNPRRSESSASPS